MLTVITVGHEQWVERHGTDTNYSNINNFLISEIIFLPSIVSYAKYYFHDADIPIYFSEHEKKQ